MVEQKLNQQKSIISKRKQSFSVVVTPYWFDVNGTPLADNTLFTAPFDLPTDFPYYLFGAFDKKGYYGQGQKLFITSNIDVNFGITGASVAIVHPNTNWRFDGLFEVGKNQTPTAFFTVFISALGINAGDLILSYTAYGFNGAPNPGYLFIVISCPQSNYLSLLENTNNEEYLIESIDMFCNNNIQNQQAVYFTTQDKFGQLKSNQVNPMLFKTQDYQQNVFIHMPLAIRLNRFKGFYSLLKWRTQKIEYVFTIKL